MLFKRPKQFSSRNISFNLKSIKSGKVFNNRILSKLIRNELLNLFSLILNNQILSQSMNFKTPLIHQIKQNFSLSSKANLSSQLRSIKLLQNHSQIVIFLSNNNILVQSMVRNHISNRLFRRNINFDFHFIPFSKFTLNMLYRSNTFKLSCNHNSNFGG